MADAHWRAEEFAEARLGQQFVARAVGDDAAIAHEDDAGDFWKHIAEVMRDLYSASTIFCGHVGDDVKSWPAGSKARGKGEWYAMQVEATNDYEVSWPVSVLCGGLDRQIEHHLFPQLPPQRLREIAPEVRAICERHGVEYRSDTWGRTLRGALGAIGHLSRNGGLREVVRSMA